MEKLEFTCVLKEICVAFQKDLDKDSVVLYYKYLCHYPINVFKRATENMIKTLRFFPKISEYIDYCEKAKKEIISEKLQNELIEVKKDNNLEIVDIRGFFEKHNN